MCGGSDYVQLAKGGNYFAEFGLYGGMSLLIFLSVYFYAFEEKGNRCARTHKQMQRKEKKNAENVIKNDDSLMTSPAKTYIYLLINL